MVLLDMLVGLLGVEIVVAHVDHGIRADSGKDTELVRQLAEKYQLPVETTKLDLGGKRDEKSARDGRHAWLKSVCKSHGADSIVTAHHADDVLETIVINMIRGTGWRGLCSLRETGEYKRPLIHMTKADIVRYAIEHELEWNEDSTNEDVRYLRNYVRHGVVPQLSLEQKQFLSALYEKQCRINGMIEADTDQLLQLATEDDDALSRYWLIMIPDGVAWELLRKKYGAMTRAQLERLLAFARTAPHGAKLELSGLQSFRVTPRQLVVYNR